MAAMLWELGQVLAVQWGLWQVLVVLRELG